MEQFKFKAKVWLYPGNAAWHFASLPKGLSRDLKNWFGEEARGWGSLPVKVKIDKTSWTTSIFPDSKTKTYLLPVKKSVREKEGIKAGSFLTFEISMRD